MLLALILLLASAPAIPAQGASSPSEAPLLALQLPERLRQGDPLIAWTAFVPSSAFPSLEAAAGGRLPELRLLGPSGAQVEVAPCFDASSLIGGLDDFPAGASLYGALFALQPTLPPGRYGLEFGWREGAGPAQASVAAYLQVEARDFPLETIKLDAANAKIRSEPSPRKDEEARRLWALLGAVDPSAVYAGPEPLLFPSEGGAKSAGFGDRRSYSYPNGSSESSVHAGLDWAVVVGTPVRACARGRVAMVADRVVTGTTLILEHLPGLYSLYFHLSKAEVAEGAIVERGQPIALSGASGLATGPHLHWELRARASAADPGRWLQSALLDKAAIKDKIIALIEGR